MALIGVLLAYNLATLGRVPAYLSDDDGCYASAAYQFWQTGKPGVPGYKDIVGLGRDVWAFGRIAAAVQGVFLHFFGISIFAALFPSFLAGLALLACTAALGRALWDWQTALLAVLLLAASGKFFDACRWARPDILLAFCFVLALWLAASAPAGRPCTKLFLSGLVMGFAGDVHLNGFLIAPVPLLFWFLLRAEPAPLRVRAGLAFMGGGLIGGIFWFLTHFWPNPAQMLRQAALYGGRTHSLGILEMEFWKSIQAEAHRYTSWFWAARGHRHLLEGACVLAGGVWVLRRESRRGVAIAGAWVAVFLISAAFMPNKFGWYLILVWPIFALWMARFFQAFHLRPLALAYLGLLIAAYFVNLGLWHSKARADASLQSKFVALRTAIPAEAPVLGNGVFWLAFWDRDFTDEYYLRFRREEAEMDPASGPAEWTSEQRKFGWHYIVASNDFGLFLDPAVPIERFMSGPEYTGRRDDIYAARNFSLQHCSVERRIPGNGDNILVLRVDDAGETSKSAEER
jgi:4-amino-4-deoxy-L-arabinose transferase-like glycosyltransferase